MGFKSAVSLALPLAPSKQHIQESRIVGEQTAACNLLQLILREFVFLIEFHFHHPFVSFARRRFIFVFLSLYTPEIEKCYMVFEKIYVYVSEQMVFFIPYNSLWH